MDLRLPQHQRSAQPAALCCLSDTAVDSGTLRVLPASHASSVPLRAALPEAHSEDSNTLGLKHQAMADHQGQLTIALRAGDAVVTDYRCTDPMQTAGHVVVTVSCFRSRLAGASCLRTFGPT
jgi:ectoine hydroxylase-related dioxygenase (phytanoyl-CoA dioxygenase family)